MGRRSGSDGGSSVESSEEIEWEMRPGGMLVQKRCTNVEAAHVAPEVRIRVSYGGARFEVLVRSQATFGDLKKLLVSESGLEPGEQKLIYRGKERGNREYLDVCGIKNRSKLVLMEDASSRERKFVEMQRNAKIQIAHRAISYISLEVDKLADQITSIEKSISSGNKIAEVQITTLIEMLMRQAIKLDSVPDEADTSSQKNMQAERVQKCVETLDALKISNARVKPVIVTTKWVTFDPPATAQWECFD